MGIYSLNICLRGPTVFRLCRTFWTFFARQFEPFFNEKLFYKVFNSLNNFWWKVWTSRTNWTPCFRCVALDVASYVKCVSYNPKAICAFRILFLARFPSLAPNYVSPLTLYFLVAFAFTKVFLTLPLLSLVVSSEIPSFCS